MIEDIETFLAKVDAFSAGLSPAEQAMFAHLISDDADDEDAVEGFNFYEGWPCKVRDVAPIKVEGMGTKFDPFLSSGHSTGINEAGKRQT